RGATGGIATGPVTRRQSPNVAGISRAVQRVGNAIRALGDCCTPRVLEVSAVVAVHVSVRNMPEVDPTMGVLVAEKRRKWDKSQTIIRGPVIAAGPAAPSRCGQRIRRSAKAE